jgi:hypothetical protein
MQCTIEYANQSACSESRCIDVACRLYLYHRMPHLKSLNGEPFTERDRVSAQYFDQQPATFLVRQPESVV